MNERIKELANIWANRRSEDEKLGITYTFSEKALETFAQLIVRECAWIANDPAPSVYDHDSYKLGRKFAGIDVLKHFGVEK